MIKSSDASLQYKFDLQACSGEGLFSGYASVFGVKDKCNDVMVRGAFKELNAKDVKLLWQHNPGDPIGQINLIQEDEKGLYLEAQLLLNVQKGFEAFQLLKAGAVDGLSIGYTPVDFMLDKRLGIRKLLSVKLWEVSLVTFPANGDAKVMQVKKCHNSALADVDATSMDDVCASLDRARSVLCKLI